jgi:hypothetical protein
MNLKKASIAILASFALGLVLLPAEPAGALAPYCGITWGSQPKSTGFAGSHFQITDVRTGRHTCYDRMVVHLNGPAANYDVRYVDNVYADGSGELIPLRGAAKLQIIVVAPAYDDRGQPTYPGRTGRPLPGVNLTGYQTFRDAKFAGSFEGQTTFGLGTRARLPFRVFKLGTRVVLDVAHQW